NLSKDAKDASGVAGAPHCAGPLSESVAAHRQAQGETSRMSLPMKIVGVGRYLPERVVTSAEVERLCGIKPGWIERHTGVKERRWVGPRESNSFMGAAAAREAVKDAGLTLEDIDLILCAAGTPEQTIPDNSALLQRELGLGKSGTSCMSVHITCLSFLLAMDLASVMLSVDRYKNILIV